jgi:hypothetical protein
MNRKLRFAFLSALTLFLFPVPALATLIAVEPDNFALGTDIRLSVAGVTLSVVGEAGTAVIVVSGDSNFLGRNAATTGTRMFGQNPGDGPAIPDIEKFWNEDQVGVLRADFSLLADFVQIDVIFDDDDIGFLRAYDSSGTLLDTVSASGDGRLSGQEFARLSITRPNADIAYMITGGSDAEGLYLDNLQVNVVPVPAAAWLLGSGAVLLLFRTRRAAGATRLNKGPR